MGRNPVVRALLAVSAILAAGGGSAIHADWIQFQDETDSRFAAAPEAGASDVDEKDYAWGDVDKDGDIDLVVVRKEPFTSLGKRVNYLFINENGVLTDRTAEFATTSDVPGDLGFQTPTNDRDVQLVDLDLDGWLDIVTAVTLSDGDPKHIGHPRVYVNLRCTAPCQGTEDWQGFRYEETRIPVMLTYEDLPGFNPRFASVAVGDVTGDGYPDLWFGDYDSSGAEGGNEMPEGADFNDRLLVNQGASNPGHFTDETNGSGGRFSGDIDIPGAESTPFPVSAFGAAGAIADINGDGVQDIVKQTALNPPEYVGIAYNDPDNEGFFDDFEVVNQIGPYHIDVGDLNNDDLLDIVVGSFRDDRYLINQGVGTDGRSDFLSFIFSFAHFGGGGPASDDNFNGDAIIADLNRDGWNDVLIADVEVDLPGCTRRTHIYRNLGGLPGSNVTLQEQTTGAQCQFFFGNPPSCIVASIPSDKLEGTHDIAVFDIDGDEWPDLVVGRCTGTEIYINQPSDPAGGVPDGDSVPGTMLEVRKLGGGPLQLSWDESCSLQDDDYAVYEGSLSSGAASGFTVKNQLTCSTGGLASYTVPSAGSSKYYLAVPHNGGSEGIYGFASDGTPRSQCVQACLPMNPGACP